MLAFLFYIKNNTFLMLGIVEIKILLFIKINAINPSEHFKL